MSFYFDVLLESIAALMTLIDYCHDEVTFLAFDTKQTTCIMLTHTRCTNNMQEENNLLLYNILGLDKFSNDSFKRFDRYSYQGKYSFVLRMQ